MAKLDEVLSITTRLKKSRAMKRNKAKIKIGRERAKRKVADKDTLMKRARKHARNLLLKKILKDVPKDELSPARKAEIEKRLSSPAMKSKIEKIALKMLPKIRKAELDRKKGSSND